MVDLDGRFIAKGHIFNFILKEGLFSQLWKSTKFVLLPKNKWQWSFSAANSTPISILPVLSKLMEKVLLEQIQYYTIFHLINSTLIPRMPIRHITLRAQHRQR